MSVESLSSQFGKAEFCKEFEHDGRQGVVVIELWKGRRWIILYYLLEQNWVVAERYAVCRQDVLPPWIRQEYAPRWYQGASVDGEGSYIVIEKSDHVWLLLYDGNVEYCCLLDVIELPSLDVVPYSVDQYLSYLLESNALVRLREVLPVLASICEVYLIDTIPGRIAYMMEDNGVHRRLFRYLWVEEAWLLEGPFEPVDQLVRESVPQKITDISGVFEGRNAQGLMRIVVEDGICLRWWHTYIFLSPGWSLDNSHHAEVEGDEDNGVMEEVDQVEPEIVEEIDDGGDV